MNVDEIKNGFVIDHIQAGQGMEIYRFLGLEHLDCPIAIIKNASSRRMGKNLYVCFCFVRKNRATLPF